MVEEARGSRQRTSPELGKALFYAVYLAVAGVLIGESFRISPGSRLVPLSALVVLAALLVLRLAGCVWPAFGWRLDRWGARGSPDEGEAGEALLSSQAPVKQILVALGWWVVGGLGTYVFGFLLTMPVFLTLFPWLYGRKPLWAAALFALGTTAAMFFLFEGLMHLRLFRGVLAWPVS